MAVKKRVQDFKKMVSIGRIVLLLLGLHLMPQVLAEPAVEGVPEAVEIEKEIGVLEKDIAKLAKALKNKEVNKENIALTQKRLVEYQGLFSQLKAMAKQNLEAINKDLTVLGDAAKNSSSEMRQKRGVLLKKRSEAEKQQEAIKLMQSTLGEAKTEIAKLTAAKKKREIEMLLEKGFNTYRIVETLVKNPSAVPAALQLGYQQRTIGLVLGYWELAGFTVIVLSSLMFGWFTQRYVAKVLNPQIGQQGFFTQFRQSLLREFARRLGLVLAVGLLLGYFYNQTLPATQINFYTELLLCILIYVAVHILVRATLTPRAPVQYYLKLQPEIARPLAFHLNFLMAVTLSAYLVLWALLGHAPAHTVALLARDVFTVLSLISLAKLTQLLFRLERLLPYRPIAFLFLIVLTINLVVEVAGYRALALSLLIGIIQVAGLLALLVFVRKLVYETFRSVEAYSTRATFSAYPGDRTDAKPSLGILFIEVPANVALWGTGLVLLVAIFDKSTVWVAKLSSYLIDGFSMGSLHLSPLRIILASVLFGLMYFFIRWIKHNLERKWLASTRFDTGAKEAAVTIVGYSTIIISVLIALSIAGVEIQNLAIVFGALSVGIGFGLQNIVNNFVSGLILLFERPIRAGDWIVVGNVEGYVRRVRIRSTHIQTFDKADVIVPNSELISTKVTNWMLYDLRGRVRIPISVAYQTDVENVRKVLIAIATAHPDVIKDNERYLIKVLFIGFGDSALNFELRCFIKNIDRRIDVVSDLNFQINQKFKEENILIPFPQRDMHIYTSGNKDLEPKIFDDQPK